MRRPLLLVAAQTDDGAASRSEAESLAWSTRWDPWGSLAVVL